MRLAYKFIWVLITIIYATIAKSMADDVFSTIPEESNLDPRIINLGKKLFHENKLSKNNKISCASCHIIPEGGVVPGEQYSIPGVSGKAVKINIPTIFNSAFNHVQFWDGRAENLEQQLDGPTHNIDEMGSSWPEIIKKLAADHQYLALFKSIYNSYPTEANIKNAIATFERSLITPNSPFDKYLKGDSNALSQQAKLGYKLFKSYGCASCHQGINLGGNMFQTMGIMGDYFKDRGNINDNDLGRYNVTNREEDKYVFRVPPLRNVAITAPYFHDGYAKTLEQAVNIMAKYQLGRELSVKDKAALVEFLKSLTGTLP